MLRPSVQSHTIVSCVPWWRAAVCFPSAGCLLPTCGKLTFAHDPCFLSLPTHSTQNKTTGEVDERCNNEADKIEKNGP